MFSVLLEMYLKTTLLWLLHIFSQSRANKHFVMQLSVNHSSNAEILIPIKDVDFKDLFLFNTYSDLNKVICWWKRVTLCWESNAIDHKERHTAWWKPLEMNAFGASCHFVWLIELSIATYNILQENIDLTLSLSVTLTDVVIVWVQYKTNKGSNCPIWQELLVSNNGSPSPTKELQQWTVTSMWPEEPISTPLKPWNVKCEPRALAHPKVRQECATNFLC